MNENAIFYIKHNKNYGAGGALRHFPTVYSRKKAVAFMWNEQYV